MRKLPGDQQVGFITKLLRGNVAAIVEHEDDIEIAATRFDRDLRVDFVVRVHHDDIGLVIGERGATADAIRRIVWIACKKTDLRVGIRFE